MFGSALRDFRLQLGLQQAAVAMEAGIRPHTLWRHEAGQHVPNVRTLERLASAMAKLSNQPIVVGDLIALFPSEATHGPTLRSRISKSKSHRKSGKSRNRSGET